MPLTVKQIEAAQPGKHFDGGGLYLEVRPSGSKLWRLKYRWGGKERRISFGAYPEVGLREARLRTEEARRQLRDGIDPSAHRQAQRRVGAEDSLEAVAREWWVAWQRTKSPTHSKPVLRALERDVFPRIGHLPITEIEPVTILPALRAVEHRGAVDTAHRIRGYLGMAFRYAVATGRAQRDPTADLRGALAPVINGHMAAVTDPEDFGGLLRAIDEYGGHLSTSLALRLAPLVFLRPGELRQAEWSEIDMEGATWIIPAHKMKLRRDHVVPLARQALEILEQAQRACRGSRYVFPSLRTTDRPMSNNTLNAALRRLGYSTEEATTHGFRASFRTIGDEVLGFRPDLMEHQLAHAVRDPLGRAYNRAQFLDERRVMMQRWADWCDEAREKARRKVG